LTERLQDAGVLPTGTTIGGFRAEPLAPGIAFSSRIYRLQLSKESAGGPKSIIVKLPSAHASDAMIHWYRSEVVFYRDFAGRMDIHAPRLYYGYIRPSSFEFVLLLEDIVESEPADQVAGLTLEQCLGGVRLLADFHAANWEHERLGRYGDVFLPMRSTPIVAHFPERFGSLWNHYLSVARVRPADLHRALMDRYPELMEGLLDELSRPLTLIHGDPRGDNWFFDGNDRARILDFQSATQACGMVDVSYLATQSLTIETRRGNDRRIVEEYVRRLRGHGIGAYSFDLAWRQYRLGSLLMILMPLVASGAWERTDARGRELCLVLMERALTAIEELDVAELLPPGRGVLD